MPLKLIGCLTIFLAGVTVSFIIRRSANVRLSQLDGVISLLRYIRACIESYNSPIASILAGCAPDILIACGCHRECRDLQTLVSSLSPSPSGEIAQILGSCAAEFGSGYREEQLRSLDHHIVRLDALREPMKDKTEKEKKLATALCLSAAAMLVILLL